MPRRIAFLGPEDELPPSSEALEYPSGLLAAGGNLSTASLIAAYRRGVFPWYEEPQPVLWWTPDPRAVLFPQELHISRSLRKVLRRDQFSLGVDSCFGEVISACARPRPDSDGTWIGSKMLRAYNALHQQGVAHSVEVLDASGELVGGLYGVAQGGAFFGESMFSQRPDASKVALVGLVNIMLRGGFHLVDCQVGNPHLTSMGARDIDRLDFEARLAQTIDIDIDPGIWSLPGNCGALL